MSFSRAELKSGLAQVGSNRGWASEAVLRKGVGGSSAVVAVSGELTLSNYLSSFQSERIDSLFWLGLCSGVENLEEKSSGCFGTGLGYTSCIIACNRRVHQLNYRENQVAL